MNHYETALLSHQEKLRTVLEQLERNQSTYRSLPDFRVRVCSSNGSPQYHLTNSKAGYDQYAGKKQRDLVGRIVQKEYEEKLSHEIQKQLSLVDRFLKEFDPQCFSSVYNQLPAGKQILVAPVEETDEEFVRRWYMEHPGGKNKEYADGDILTERGERVRSKSEKIIADLLAKYNVPYAYETEIRLRPGYVAHPDFTILNRGTRKTIYWEHFGKLDDAEYTFKNLRRLNDYDRSGYELGEDLIVTMESKRDVIDVRAVEEKILKYCI